MEEFNSVAFLEWHAILLDLLARWKQIKLAVWQEKCCPFRHTTLIKTIWYAKWYEFFLSYHFLLKVGQGMGKTKPNPLTDPSSCTIRLLKLRYHYPSNFAN